MGIYIHSEAIHNVDVPRKVVPVIMDMVRPTSVLDVGCGTGTWLKAFQEHAVVDFVGVDGDHVNQTQLKIPVDNFVTADLHQSLKLNKRFDLVISLEVAEHLREEASDTFVQSLIAHGDVIIFSAAIPGQGYWERKFGQYGFYFHNTLREALWHKPELQWWYTQNIFLVTKEKAHKGLIDVVHPELFEQRNTMLEQVHNGDVGVKIAFRIFRSALKKWILKKLGAK
jgi:SAM-dependent methyltransferase